MTAQDDPYVRVYYRIMEDPKFATVIDDKAALGWWLALLIGADGMYPAPATLPHGISKSKLTLLVDAGLVDLLPGSRYRLHGLTAEREKRSERGRRAAAARYGQSTSTARAVLEQSTSNRSAVHSDPLRTEPIQSAPLRAEPSARAKENGSKTETEEERHARYVALQDDPTQNADIRAAARKAVELYEVSKR